MFKIKLEALIYVLVACLTLVVPCTAYLVFADQLKNQSDEASKSAQRFELLAKDIEQGKIKIYLENFPTALRHQAKEERVLSDMYSSFGSAARHFLLSMVAIAIVQFSLLLLVLRRRNMTSGSTPTPEDAG